MSPPGLGFRVRARGVRGPQRNLSWNPSGDSYAFLLTLTGACVKNPCRGLGLRRELSEVGCSRVSVRSLLEPLNRAVF